MTDTAGTGVSATPIRAPGGGLSRWVTYVGCAGFIAVLAISAWFDHTIVWLHLFQALMYVAVIALIARDSRWGAFLGVSIAGLWNYTNLFVTTFFRSGLQAVGQSLDQGRIVHPDQIVAVGAISFHFLVIGGCVAAYLRMSRRPLADAAGFAAVAAGSTAYFAAIMALFQPRYLPLFARMLHPHAL
jgi:hypothetical protein